MSKNPVSEEDQLRAQYVDVWNDVKRQGERKITLGKQLQKQGAWERDVAEQFLASASIIPGGAELEEVLDSAEQLAAGQQSQLSVLKEPVNLGGTAVISAGSVSAAFDLVSPSKMEYLSPPQRERAETVRTNFKRIFARHDKKSDVLELMSLFDFNETTEGQQALHQFEAAWDVHEQSPPTPTSSLIPVRQAILSTINELIRRRPQQRPVKNKEKIIELGNQAAATGIGPAQFQRLQEEWSKLNDGLSGFKEARGTRETEEEAMMKATLFLFQLLTALDPDKF